MGSKYEKKENEKDYGKKDDEKKDDDKYGDKKDMDEKDKEPSAESKAAMKACTEHKLCKELMECMKEHTESGGKGDGKGDHEHGKGGCADFSEKECEAQKKLPCSWDDGKCAMKKKPTEEVCVKEMKACAADKECSLLHYKLQHYKLQDAKKGGKDGDYGGKGGDGKYDDKKEGGYGGNDGDKKKDDDGGDYGKGKKSRQLHQHEKGGDGDKKSTEKKDMGSKYEKKENEKDYGKKRRQLAGHGDHSHDDDDDKKKDMDKKKEDMDKKKEEYGDKKDKEPSAELKAAMKACTENKLCKELMECKKKHKESGGKGDGKGDHEEVCVKEAKACAADKECSTLHEKLQAAMKKDGGHGGHDDDDHDDDDKKKEGYEKKEDYKKGDGKKGR